MISTGAERDGPTARGSIGATCSRALSTTLSLSATYAGSGAEMRLPRIEEGGAARLFAAMMSRRDASRLHSRPLPPDDAAGAIPVSYRAKRRDDVYSDLISAILDAFRASE